MYSVDGAPFSRSIINWNESFDVGHVARGIHALAQVGFLSKALRLYKTIPTLNSCQGLRPHLGILTHSKRPPQ